MAPAPDRGRSVLTAAGPGSVEDRPAYPSFLVFVHVSDFLNRLYLSEYVEIPPGTMQFNLHYS